MTQIATRIYTVELRNIHPFAIYTDTQERDTPTKRANRKMNVKERQKKSGAKRISQTKVKQKERRKERKKEGRMEGIGTLATLRTATLHTTWWPV